METQLLMTPGPTIVPERILNAMAKPVIHHRTPEFVSIFQDCSERLKNVFKTKNGVYIIAGSGTAAMEASICNTISPGDKVLSIVSGKFSERLRDIAKTYGADVNSLEFEWGSEVKLDRVKEALTEDTKLVTAVHNETSTGVRNPIKGNRRATKRHGHAIHGGCNLKPRRTTGLRQTSGALTSA